MAVKTVEASSLDLKRLVDQVQSAHELVLTRDAVEYDAKVASIIFIKPE